jgi:hypothetical protein
MNASDAGATGIFCVYFLTFYTLAFPPPQKKKIFHNCISNELNIKLGPPAGLMCNVRRKGAAPLSGAEEQNARAISAHTQCA